jgi:cytochrome c556
MRRFSLLLLCTAALSACGGGGDDGNRVLAEANKSGAEASAAVENQLLGTADTPLEREAALALMEKRHEGYEKIGRAMRAAKQAIDQGNAAAVKGPADQLATLAPQAIGWFPAGTGPDVGKTEARAEIWQQRAEFDQGMQRFNQAARLFQQAAAGGDLAAIRKAHADLGGTCKSCHDRFRLED